MAAAGNGLMIPTHAAPINPDLTYDVYFERFTDYIYNGFMGDDDYLGYAGYPEEGMMEELAMAKYDTAKEAKVHNKYITHFFGGNPAGAQNALNHYLYFIANNIYNRGVGKDWKSYGGRPFIKSYLANGAKLLEKDIKAIINEAKREIKAQLGYNVNKNNNDAFDDLKEAYKRLDEFEVVLLQYMESERKAARGENALPLLPNSPPNSNNNSNQSGGKHRHSRRNGKSHKQRRKTTRRQHRRRN
jgi:hypothetical protein